MLFLLAVSGSAAATFALTRIALKGDTKPFSRAVGGAGMGAVAGLVFGFLIAGIAEKPAELTVDDSDRAVRARAAKVDSINNQAIISTCAVCAVFGLCAGIKWRWR